MLLKQRSMQLEKGRDVKEVCLPLGIWEQIPLHAFEKQIRVLVYAVKMIQCKETRGESKSDNGEVIRLYHQPDGIANANILDFSGCAVWEPSVTPKTGDKSTPRIFAFDSGPPPGVAGELEDAGDVVLEKVGEGVSGVLGSAPQEPLFGVPGLSLAGEGPF